MNIEGENIVTKRLMQNWSMSSLDNGHVLVSEFINVFLSNYVAYLDLGQTYFFQTLNAYTTCFGCLLVKGYIQE